MNKQMTGFVYGKNPAGEAAAARRQAKADQAHARRLEQQQASVAATVAQTSTWSLADLFAQRRQTAGAR